MTIVDSALLSLALLGIAWAAFTSFRGDVAFGLFRLAMVLALCEDLLRKLLDLPVGVTTVKDAVLLAAYAVVSTRRDDVVPRAVKLAAWWLGFVLVALAVMQVALGIVSLGPTLVGLRSYLFYLPCILLGANLAAKREREFSTLLLGGLVISSLCGVLAALAHFHVLPPAEALRPLSEEASLHSFGEGSGTGIPLSSSIFGVGDRLARHSLTGLLLYLGLAARWRLELAGWQRALLLCGYAMGIIVSGRRTAWALTFIGLMLLVALSRSSKTRAAARLMVGALGIIAMLYLFGGLSWLNFAGSAAGESAGRSRDVMSIHLRDPFSGSGIGRASQGIVSIAGGRFATTEAETGLKKVSFEAGLIGLGSYLLLLGIVGAHLFRSSRRSQDRGAAAITVLYACLVLWFLKGAQILGDSQTLLHLWTLVGAAFAWSAVGLRESRGSGGQIAGAGRSAKVRSGSEMVKAALRISAATDAGKRSNY